MPNTVTPHTIFAQDQYNKALYQLLLMLEESGTVKIEAYTDGKGIPSVGVGINIRERARRENIKCRVQHGFKFIRCAGTRQNSLGYHQ